MKLSYRFFVSVFVGIVLLAAGIRPNDSDGYVTDMNSTMSTSGAGNDGLRVSTDYTDYDTTGWYAPPSSRHAPTARAAGPFGELCSVSHNRYSSCRTTVICSGVNFDAVNVTNLLLDMSLSTCKFTLANSPLSTLPMNFLNDFNQIQYFNLVNLSISNLNKVISRLSHTRQASIRHVDLSHNSIATIPRASFSSFHNLRTLVLEGNLLTSIRDYYFSNLETLTLLDLRKNQIQKLENGTFFNLTKLQTLNLDNNLLTDLPAEIFNGLKDLTSVSLNKNRLTNIIPGTLSQSTALLDLFLQENLFQVLTKSMIDSPQLCQVYMAYNQIRTIQEEAIPFLRNIPNVYMNDNQLASLPEGFFDYHQVPFKRIAIQFKGNPWSCDCSSQYFLWRMKRSLERDRLVCSDNDLAASGEANLLCASPTQNAGKVLTNITWSELGCGVSEFEGEICHQRSKLTSDRTQCSNLWHTSCASKERRVHSCVCAAEADTCFVCPAGSYGMHKPNGTLCTHCQPFHTSDYGATSWKNCQCSAGFQPRSTNITECEGCPINFYKSQAGSHSCVPCSVNSVTLHLGAVRCECLPGFTETRGGGCHACPESTFKQHFGNDQCQPCPQSCISSTGSISLTNCTNCTNINGSEYLKNPIKKCSAHISSCELEVSAIFFSGLSTEISPTTSESLMEFNQWIIILILSLCGVIIVIALPFLVLRRVRIKSSVENNYKDTKSVISNVQDIPSPTSIITSENACYRNYDDDDLTKALRVELSQIRFDRLLGQGAFGQVHSAVVTGLKNSQLNSVTVAVKSLRDGHSFEEKEALHTELQQLLYVGQHPNIINLLGFANCGDNLMLIIEHAAHGDLLSYLKDKVLTTAYAEIRFEPPSSSTYLTPKSLTSPASWPLLADERQPPHTPDDVTSPKRAPNNVIDQTTLLSISWQVAKGMSHLARMKCIHRDLAARNVLIGAGLVAKVSDFGLARAVYESGYYFKETKGRLPFKWMPPEAILEGQYTTKSDVWSLGILLWELFTLGGNPYPGVPIHSLLDLIQSGYRMAKPSNCQTEVYNVMRSCWLERPRDRPSFESLSESLEKILQITANRDYLELHPNEMSSSENEQSSYFSDWQEDQEASSLQYDLS